MKNLAEYLKGRKKADFARKIGVSPAQLSQYLSGYRRPSYGLMLQIEAETGGEVSIRSWPHSLANGYTNEAFQGQAAKQGCSA